ncbi:MAG: hypothetical protein GIX03_10270 [Candidatus Eremiobacteraeota bacterium]|nr:hypothetical protein [Candidatus Eremiobacteraeota bacterium]MBC5803356.1 hypothetical protein [Candidatus Eremiobacteraeota bacterium]MBC5822146.1 hypothetical protein [Candidatus Eremiobacteraeota bacterium]
MRLALIVAVALGVRLYALGTNPLEPHADELAGLVGVSNVLHGRAPLLPFFDLRVEYLPLYGIFETVATSLLGPSTFAMRLPAALLGVISVAALRWFTYELCAGERSAHGRTQACVLADGAAALFAVLPWSIHISRLGWENAAVFPFVLGGLAALERGLRLRGARWLLLAGVLLGIGAYSYRAEPVDGVLLGATLVAARWQDARKCMRWLALAAAVALGIAAPLGTAVATHPRFFWRDANIATFGHGYTVAAVGTFVHNYAAHFALGPLFGYGDGILDHGPHYGELYWWMLPFLIVGLVTAPRLVGRPGVIVLWVWLAIYPLGGALTDDGVPDFPRTMIGAPLACILAAMGLGATYRWLGRFRAAARWRELMLTAVGVTAAFAFGDFARVYFTVYPAMSADAFKYGTASLFHTVRVLGTGEQRVCFGSLDWYNYDTFVDFYMRDSPLAPIEGLGSPCTLPGSLIVVDAPGKAPVGAKLVGAVPNYEGNVMAYVFKI